MELVDNIYEKSTVRLVLASVGLGECRTLWGEREQAMHYTALTVMQLRLYH